MDRLMKYISLDKAFSGMKHMLNSCRTGVKLLTVAQYHKWYRYQKRDIPKTVRVNLEKPSWLFWVTKAEAYWFCQRCVNETCTNHD